MRCIAMLALTVLLSQSVTAGTVIITSVPRGASVTVNGEVIGKTPLRTRLAAGLHDLEVSGRDYATHTERLEVSTKLLQHSVTLKPKTYPVDVLFADFEQTGWAIYNGARLVLTEGGKIATTPMTIQLTKGKHKIRAMKPGFKDIGVAVTVTPPKDEEEAESTLVEISATPKKGYSSFGRCKQALVVGTWYKPVGNRLVTVVYSAAGTWSDGWTAQVPFKLVGRGDYKVAEGMNTEFVLLLNGNRLGDQRFVNAKADELAGKWQMFRTKPVICAEE